MQAFGKDVSPVIFFSYPSLELLSRHFQDDADRVCNAEDEISIPSLRDKKYPTLSKERKINTRFKKMKKSFSFHLISTIIVPHLVEMKDTLHALERPTSIPEFCRVTKKNESRAKVLFRMLTLMRWMERSETQDGELYCLLESGKEKWQGIPEKILKLIVSCYTSASLGEGKIFPSEMKDLALRLSRNWDTNDLHFRSLLTGSILVPLLHTLQREMKRPESNFLAQLEGDQESEQSGNFVTSVLIKCGMLKIVDNVIQLSDDGQFYLEHLQRESPIATLQGVLDSFPDILGQNQDSDPFNRGEISSAKESVTDSDLRVEIEKFFLKNFPDKREGTQSSLEANYTIPFIGATESKFSRKIFDLLTEMNSEHKCRSDETGQQLKFIPNDSFHMLKDYHQDKKNQEVYHKWVCTTFDMRSTPDEIFVAQGSEVGIEQLRGTLKHVSAQYSEAGLFALMEVCANLSRIKNMCTSILFIQKNPGEKKDMKKMTLEDLDEFLHGDEGLDLRTFLALASMVGWFPTYMKCFPCCSPKYSMMSMNHENFQFRLLEESQVNDCVSLEAQHWPVRMRTPREIIVERIRRHPGGQFSLSRNGKLLAVMYSQRINNTDRLKKWSEKENLHTQSGKFVQLLDVFINTEDSEAMLLGGFLRNFVKVLTFSDPSVEAVVAVTRGREYQKEKQKLSYEDYTKLVGNGEINDKGLNFHLSFGAHVVRTIPEWRPEDEINEGYGVLIRYCR